MTVKYLKLRERNLYLFFSESQKVENREARLFADQLGRNETSFLTKVMMDGPSTIDIGRGTSETTV